MTIGEERNPAEGERVPQWEGALVKHRARECVVRVRLHQCIAEERRIYTRRRLQGHERRERVNGKGYVPTEHWGEEEERYAEYYNDRNDWSASAKGD